jgi:hypothetical protein
MGIPTSLARAKRLSVYWDNYQAYLSTLEGRQENVGQGKPKPEQIALYIKPFGIDLATDQYLRVNGTKGRWDTFKSVFSNRTKETITAGQVELDLNGMRPAKVVVKTGLSTTLRVVTAKTTKRKYATYGGEAGSIPLGQNTAAETEFAAFQAVKIALEAGGGGYNKITMRVSRIKEKV